MDYKEIFYKDSVEKQIYITSDDGLICITNNELNMETFELSESLCSDKELTFGKCSAALLKFTVSNVFISMKDKWLTVEITVGGDADRYRIGRYKVYSDKATADRSEREVIAYDVLYDVINADVADWYNSIFTSDEITMTMREFRNSFWQHFSIKQEEIQLINDDMQVKKTISPEKLSGAVVLNCICEINGCMGHIKDINFKYIYLEQNIKGLYPSETLYPSDTLYPIEPKGTRINKSQYISAEYEDYLVNSINKVQIRQEEDDIGAVAGNGTNAYIIEDNFLVYGKGAEELSLIAENILNRIRNLVYRPYSTECVGNPCLELGAAIRLRTKYELIESYILNRTLTGIQALRDSYSATGEQYRSTQVTSSNSSIVQLKGKLNKLTRTVEETKSELADVESGLSSKIEQTAGGIRTELSNMENGLSSKIEQTADGLTETFQATYSTKTEAQGYANAAKNAANADTDTKLQSYITTTAAKTEIEKTADSLKAQIKASTTVWDIGDYSNLIKVSGFDAPSDEMAGRYPDQLYFNQADGKIYFSTRVDSGSSYHWEYIETAKCKVENAAALWKATAESIETKVSKGEIASAINQTAQSVKISADKIELDGAVIANATISAPVITGAVIAGGAVTFGEGNIVVVNAEGIWVLGTGNTDAPDFKVDTSGFVHLGKQFKMSPIGAWWTDDSGIEHFKSWAALLS